MKLAVVQVAVALEIGGCQVALGLRGRQLGPSGIGRQPQILRIELRQHLAGLHVLAELRLPLDDLARHPETQPGLDPRPHFTRKLGLAVEGVEPDGDELHRRTGSAVVGVLEQATKPAAKSNAGRMMRDRRGWSRGSAGMVSEFR